MAASNHSAARPAASTKKGGRRPSQVIADKVYDVHAILVHIEAIGAVPVIPQRSCMKRSRDFDPKIYKERNRIERTIGHLKQLRRISARYDQVPKN